MIRILQLGMTDNLGGIESYLINYYRYIDKTKIQFDFINIYDNKVCFQDEIEKMGGEIYKVPNYYRQPFKYLKMVRKIINEQKYNIIHCNMNSAVMLYPLIAAKSSKAKIIIAHSHNSSSDKGILKSILHNLNKKFIPLLANQFFACSEVAGKWFFNKKIINSNNFHIIPNAIEIEKFKYNENIRAKKRKEMKIDNECVILGHVGRFNKQKNHTFLVDVFKSYYEINKNSKLILIGIGPLKKKIEEKVKELEIENNVIFLGQRNDINELYQVMDIFLLPSLYEGLPLVGIEAQTSGLYCLFSMNITKEVRISHNSCFLPIDNIKSWVNNIVNKKENSREYTDLNRLYDIKNASNSLTKKYLEFIEMSDKK